MTSFKPLYNLLPIRYNNRELSIITIEDLNAYIDILTSNFYNEFLDYNFKKDISKENLYKALECSTKHYEIKSDKVIDVRLLLKDVDTHEIIGGCSVICKDKELGVLELSYFIMMEHQGHNEAYYMVDSLINMISKSDMKFNYISAVVQSINVRSIKLLGKLGFKLVNTVKGKHTLNNIYHKERK